MPLSSPQLRDLQSRLRLEKLRRTAELARLQQKRQQLFQSGAQVGSETLQRSYARQVLALDQQMHDSQRLLQLVDRQAQLVGRILFAREAAGRLEGSPLAHLDVEELLTAVQKARTQTQAALDRLDALLAVLDQQEAAAAPAPARHTPPAAQPPIPATPSPRSRSSRSSTSRMETGSTSPTGSACVISASTPPK